MKKILTSSLFLLLFLTVIHAAPSVGIQGENYEIASLAQGTRIFLNRTNMSLRTVPGEYAGWKATRINANSTYLPGPLPSFKVKPDADGYIYTMVANVESPSVCSQWAADNNWTLIPDQKLYYGDPETQAFAFYRKACVKDQWMDIIQPKVFSGAVLIAPDIREDADLIPAVAVSVRAIGYMETGVLNNGVLAYANRSYVFGNVNSALRGIAFTRYNGGVPPVIDVTAEETGEMYIAVSNEDTSYDPEANGWALAAGLDFNYNDPNTTVFSVYKKQVNQGDVITIAATGWQGVLVLASQIGYEAINTFAPPPGVVIHNSKAGTNIYIGSPSIVKLADGTYIASHDYFGTTTQTFVYKSLDEGKTWTEISRIMYLKWATVFRRANELYLIGVRVNGAEYGNTVILKSMDDGVTWTTPADSKTGLLLAGYYHCAPVPVVKHNGRYWRAMEDRGEANGSWGNFKSFMMSVDENADLSDASNWTFSNEVVFNPGTGNYGNAWLEGNAVVAKDGSLKNILRVNYAPDNIAAVVDVSADGKTSSFNPETGFITLPGALKKFTIRYDSVSDKYWTLSNFVLDESKALSSNNERIRNTVVLSWSDDLIHWNIKDTLLHHPDVATHGFQYLDWLFEGNDIIAVSRTAWEDETGPANSQHNANYVTFHRFENFRFAKASEESSVRVKTWKNGASAAIALTFDDGFKAHFDYAYPVLKNRGIPATFFVNSGNLVHQGETAKDRYGYWEDFKTMAGDGYEIASHALTHADLTSASASLLLDELLTDKKNIEANTGTLCLTHAYPYCLRNETVDAIAASVFIAGRRCGGLANDYSLRGDDLFAVNSDLLGWIYPRSIANEQTSATDFKTRTASDLIATNKFGVACIHEVLPFDLLHTSDTYEVATTEWLSEICDYLDMERTAGTIWPATFADIIRYMKERDDLRVGKKILADGSILYEFGDRLNDEIYDLPLTIDIDLPTSWNQVKVSVLEGEKIISENIYTASEKSLTLDVIPDRQQVLFVDAGTSGITSPGIPAFTCFPESVDNILNIRFSGGFYGRYAVFDLQGRVQAEGLLQNIPSGISSVDMSALQSGLYIISLTADEGGRFYSKFRKK